MKPAIFIGFLLLLAPVALARGVGYSSFNASVWKFWNSGPVENETYISTDLVQLANRPHRFAWGGYKDCLFDNESNSWCIDDLGDFNKTISSDNASFWSFSGSKTFGIGSRSQMIQKSFGQFLGDEMVNRTISVGLNLTAVLDRKWYVGFCIQSPNVDFDFDNDTINWEENGKTRADRKSVV
jgi:hypothetical protein